MKAGKIAIGDIYQIGYHLVMRGDCREAGLVAKVIGESRINLILSDIPYGVAYGPTIWKYSQLSPSGPPPMHPMAVHARTPQLYLPGGSLSCCDLVVPERCSMCLAYQPVARSDTITSYSGGPLFT